ncbi:MAG: FixH family protein [Cyclobacteriaceae bacterium]|nr:FixH family protein [Cyclobacteriaceae bacterium]
MNIGKWIVFAFVMFALFIGTLVTVCMNQDISLVSQNYYKEELIYQDQIDRIQNTNALSERPIITATPDTLKIHFDQFQEIKKGEIKLFCPSNERNDKSFSVHASEAIEQIFPLNTLPRGMYKARFFWSIGEKEFFLEEIITL